MVTDPSCLNRFHLESLAKIKTSIVGLYIEPIRGAHEEQGEEHVKVIDLSVCL